MTWEDSARAIKAVLTCKYFFKISALTEFLQSTVFTFSLGFKMYASLTHCKLSLQLTENCYKRALEISQEQPFKNGKKDQTISQTLTGCSCL